MEQMQPNTQIAKQSSSKMTVLLVVLATVAGLYLIFEHGQHIFPYLPFTFLIGCLFMHLFMHSGHNGHGNTNNKVENKEGDEHVGHSH